MTLLGAILTGGASRRMNGSPKGLLPGPGGAPLALRASRLLDRMEVPSVLIGNRSLYTSLGLPIVDDTRPGEGPLAGLESALLEAQRRGASGVLLLACDMPFFGEALLRRLIAYPPASAVVPVRGGRYEPLLARYEVAVLGEVQRRLDRGERAMQPLLRALEAAPLVLSPEEEGELDDWDTPEAIRK